MDFALLAPEINSGLMYSGPGSGPMLAAAAGWDAVAAELESTASGCASEVSALTGQWSGPSSARMAAAATSYVDWLQASAAQAGKTAAQAYTAVAAYEEAFAMTVPPQLVAANRMQLMVLVATNFLGQNTPAIAACEAQYMEMWVQDATAMYGYAGAAESASTLKPFNEAPQTTNAAGQADQAAAVAKAAEQATGSAQNVVKLGSDGAAQLSKALSSQSLTSTQFVNASGGTLNAVLPGTGGTVSLGPGGSITISPGSTVSVGQGGSLVIGQASSVTLGKASAISVGQASSVTVGQGTSVGTLSIGQGGSLTVGTGVPNSPVLLASSSVTGSGPVTAGSGPGSVTIGSGSVSVGSGSVNVASGGTLSVGSDVTTASGSTTAAPGTVSVGSGSVSVGSGSSVTVAPGGEVSVSSGSLTVGPNSVAGGANSLAVAPGSEFSAGSGSLTVGSGSYVTVGDSAQFSVGGSVSYAGPGASVELSYSSVTVAQQASLQAAGHVSAVKSTLALAANAHVTVAQQSTMALKASALTIPHDVALSVGNTTAPSSLSVDGGVAVVQAGTTTVLADGSVVPGLDPSLGVSSAGAAGAAPAPPLGSLSSLSSTSSLSGNAGLSGLSGIQPDLGFNGFVDVLGGAE